MAVDIEQLYKINRIMQHSAKTAQRTKEISRFDFNRSFGKMPLELIMNIITVNLPLLGFLGPSLCRLCLMRGMVQLLLKETFSSANKKTITT